MNLAVDIGNTYSKIGFFEKGDIVFEAKVQSGEELQSLIKEKKPERAIVSSVSGKENDFIAAIKLISNVIYLDYQTPLPLNNLYLTPQTLGSDRLAGVAGASGLFPDKGALVIDAGTTITYDFIDGKNNYYGGNISPGLTMRLKALNHFTGKLPLFEKEEVNQLIGRNTKEAILTGVVNGMLGEIEGFIDRYLEVYKNFNVIVTGGDAKFFETKIKHHIFVVPNIVLIGLNRILEYNVR